MIDSEFGYSRKYSLFMDFDRVFLGVENVNILKSVIVNKEGTEFVFSEDNVVKIISPESDDISVYVEGDLQNLIGDKIIKFSNSIDKNKTKFTIESESNKVVISYTTKAKEEFIISVKRKFSHIVQEVIYKNCFPPQ